MVGHPFRCGGERRQKRDACLRRRNPRCAPGVGVGRRERPRTGLFPRRGDGAAQPCFPGADRGPGIRGRGYGLILRHRAGAEMNSTVTAIQAATAAAVFAGMKSAAAAAASPAGGIGLGGVSNSSAYAALQSAAAKKGWTGAQWAALVNVEMAEAGFNIHAQNPGSGAYGLAQFISGPSEYAQHGGNSVTAAGQAVGMVNYVAQRYGTPEAAWAHEQAFHWCGSGADMLVNRPTIFGAGERGPERVTVTPVNSGDKTGAETVRLLAALLAELRANPGATGEAVTAGLNGAARSAFYSGRYGAR